MGKGARSKGEKMRRDKAESLRPSELKEIECRYSKNKIWHFHCSTICDVLSAGRLAKGKARVSYKYLQLAFCMFSKECKFVVRILVAYTLALSEWEFSGKFENPLVQYIIIDSYI